MAESKTRPTAVDVGEFIDSVPSERRRADARKVCAMMEQVTGEKPVMWGPTMVGFGRYHYRYESGREGDAFLTGFSPRSASLVVYLDDFPRREELLGRLGKHKLGKCCLYINKLDDVDEEVLEQVVAGSWNHACATQNTC